MNEWRPYPENKPERGEDYLVSYEVVTGGEMVKLIQISAYDERMEGRCTPNPWLAFSGSARVTAFMELPKPYEP